VPDDLSKKINEVLNNKPISPEDEPADALGCIARNIAIIEPNPRDWGWWVMYLLQKIIPCTLKGAVDQAPASAD
jgi:hypothetical protein